MLKRQLCLVTIAAIVLLATTQRAAAQCTTIDFDDLAPGTAVTTQYLGVTFSGRYQGGTWSPPIIYDPTGGTTSEPYCLSARGDAQQEFSDEYLRMDFDQAQTEITFNMGVRVGCFADDTVLVRWYDAGGVLRGSRLIPVNGDLPSPRVLVFVRIESATPFTRVEIDAGVAGGCAARFELLDDLTFDVDATPPVAYISAPAALGCFCYGGEIRGSAYDADGGIANWRLERKAPADDGWTLIRIGISDVVDNWLSDWYPASSAGQGYYILRLTATNHCGLEASDTTVVWLDRVMDTVQLRSPVANMVVGGVICVDGTAWDHCVGSLSVERLAEGGVWELFDLVSPPWIINDPLAWWHTAGEPDGVYQVRVSAADICDNGGEVGAYPVIVDNTRPTAFISSPLACTKAAGRVTIRGTVNDAHLAGWVLQVTGGAIHGWMTLNSSDRPVNNGTLAQWDVSELMACAYTLRLLATDTAVLDCNDALHNQTESLVSVIVGDDACPEDIDGNGVVDLTDLAMLLTLFGAPCP